MTIEQGLLIFFSKIYAAHFKPIRFNELAIIDCKCGIKPVKSMRYWKRMTRQAIMKGIINLSYGPGIATYVYYNKFIFVFKSTDTDLTEVIRIKEDERLG